MQWTYVVATDSDQCSCYPFSLSKTSLQVYITKQVLKGLKSIFQAWPQTLTHSSAGICYRTGTRNVKIKLPSITRLNFSTSIHHKKGTHKVKIKLPAWPHFARPLSPQVLHPPDKCIAVNSASLQNSQDSMTQYLVVTSRKR